MNSAQVGVFKQSDEVSLGGLLESQNGGALKTKVGLEVLSNLADETLEGKLANEEVCALLEFTDLTKSDGTRPVAVRLLDTTGDGGRLARGLSGELLARRFASC